MDLDTLIRDFDLDLDEPVEKDGRCLLHLLIAEEDTDNLELVLGLPREGYKTRCRPDVNKEDERYGWTPLVAAINQGPQGYQAGIAALMRVGTDPLVPVKGLEGGWNAA